MATTQDLPLNQQPPFRMANESLRPGDFDSDPRSPPTTLATVEDPYKGGGSGRQFEGYEIAFAGGPESARSCTPWMLVSLFCAAIFKPYKRGSTCIP